MFMSVDKNTKTFYNCFYKKNKFLRYIFKKELKVFYRD